ncbi:GHMP family kinase ATP-binding protein [Dendrosporobacter sp. 1207_IL3150]|uniref:GHMP family kinase ATP-binding protein n=1 Tax=Dendrosporobacter sp. 1207_IL3150 TaxID=3084054 RepID=UPI002FDACCE8
MFACVKAPGSCGELVQGTIGGNNFLITCPINIYSKAIVTPSCSSQHLDAGEKTKLAVKKTLKYLNISNVNFQITVTSNLPQGKGMASSSADISAASQAVAISFGKTLTPDEIARIAISIEPTDGIFFPGIVMFDHVLGYNTSSLGNPPAITIAVFDGGGEVDTLYFNRRKDLVKLNTEKEHQVQQALSLVKRGLSKSDAYLIAKGATMSALANQTILYKPYLEKIIKISDRYGAIGVNVAHSGTVVGVMFNSNLMDKYDDCLIALQDCCPDIKFLQTVQLISGGLHLVGDINDQKKLL